MTSIGHIYMIWTPLDNSFCYIGSTFNRLHKRFQGHKDKYKHNYGEYSIHKYFNKYGIDNFKIELIKSYNVIRTHQKDFKHLYAYETLWISITKNCVNKQLPFNPLKKESNKQYYLDNKQKIIFNKKKYRQNNKEKIKEWRDNHKEERKEYDKNRYENNKKEINEKRSITINCECGRKYTLQHRARHFRTAKHIKFLENK